MVKTMPKRKRGAPKGKQNACLEPSRKACPERSRRARKHGFYSKVLDEAEQLELEKAREIEGIDDEIALLRVKIHSLLEKDPDNVKLIMEATNTLARLLRTKYNLDKTQGKGIKDAIARVIKELAIPIIGVGAAEALK